MPKLLNRTPVQRSAAYCTFFDDRLLASSIAALRLLLRLPVNAFHIRTLGREIMNPYIQVIEQCNA